MRKGGAPAHAALPCNAIVVTVAVRTRFERAMTPGWLATNRSR